jgi:putative sterol carrier protein
MIESERDRREIGTVPEFPGDAWFQEYAARINASEDYREAGSTWEGDVTYVLEADPERGVPEDVYAWLDLWHGECRGVRYGIPAEEGEAARFVIRAPYPRWKEVIRKELDPVKGMIQGKLRLKGDLPTILRHVKSANVLVNLAGSVPTEFVDERG